MQIEKITKSFWDEKTGQIREGMLYRITYKTLMVLEEDLSYAIRKMFLYARYKGLINFN